MKYILLFIITLFFSNLNAQIDSIISDGIYRTYLLHLPINYDENDKSPLVIAMHGGFGNAINIQNQSQLSSKADEENFLVVYPEGIKGGTFNIRTWNAGWCCGFASNTDIDDVGFINSLIDTLLSNYGIDSNRIYATGMSNGGFMSYRLACELSNKIAAIAPVAASMSMVECNPTKSVPLINFNSYLDTNVPHEGGYGTGISTQYSPPIDSVLNAWANLNSCSMINDTIINNNEFTHIQWSDCSCNYQNKHYITYDGGHSWPGGEQTPLGDPVSNYINATDIMWEFFKNKTLDCATTSLLGIEENYKILIYPNPTNSKLFVRTNQNSSKLQMTLYNLFGDKIRVDNNSQEIDLSNLSVGTYFLRIQLNDETHISKIVKTE